MTSGQPLRLILEFMIPCMLSQLFYQLYGMVDTVIVGRGLGVNSLAAVGSTASLNYMVLGFCMGVCNGLVIPIAQKFGARDYEMLRKFAAGSVWIAVVMAAAVTVTVCSLCMPILTWMKTPENIIQEAYDYIFIIFLGIPLTFGGNISGGIIRSLGDSRTPLYFTICASFLNVALDLAAVLGLHMGVAGAAWATVISQIFSFSMNMIYIMKKCPMLRMKKSDWKINWRIIGKLCRLGIPMGLQSSITAIGSLVIQTSVNALGTVYVTAVAAANRVTALLGTPFDSLAVTMSTYAGQNMGASKPERIRHGVRISVVIGGIYAVILFAVLYFFGQEITQILVSGTETEILQQAHRFLICNSMFFILLMLVNVFRLTIQGMGYTGLAMFAGVFEMIARTAAAFLLVPVFGFQAVCFASPMAWVCADIFLILAYRYVMRRRS